MKSVITFECVSKYYRINNGGSSLREMISSLPGRILKKSQGRSDEAGHWALNGVNFSLDQGHVMGIIGSNGAGKTTALKILCGVTLPTSGRAKINGRVSALIELGAGFHPDLTGRENIYLNGAILGLKTKEIDQKFDSIVAFSELEKFIDTPVKRYSSGMYARLGFAVAAHVDPDVLLVDEVLAVGDINFQQKCFNFISSFVNSGKTTIFVSHSLYALDQLCDQILWLDSGCVKMFGRAQDVLSAYMREQDEKLQVIDISNLQAAPTLQVINVEIADAQGSCRRKFSCGEDVTVVIEYKAIEEIQQPYFVLAIWDAATRQSIALASMLVDNQAPERLIGHGRMMCTFKNPPLMPRTYQVWGEVYGSDRKSILLQWQPVGSFAIEESNPDSMQVVSIRHQRADAPVKLFYAWKQVEQSQSF